VTLDPGGHIDHPAEFVERRLLVPGLMRTMIVIMPLVFSEHLTEVPLPIGQQMIQALTPYRRG
jgi:hypothetical protein